MRLNRKIPAILQEKNRFSKPKTQKVHKKSPAVKSSNRG